MSQVKDAISAVINVDDYGASARLLAATTLRNVLGTKNLGDILSDREAIAQDMQVRTSISVWYVEMLLKATLDEATDPWGVTVERVEVKDVRVPESLQRAMAAEAEAAREARAKVIAAEGEHKASRALRQAAEVIVDSPAALQLRWPLISILLRMRSEIYMKILQISADIEQHLRWEQQHHRVPRPHRHNLTAHQHWETEHRGTRDRVWYNGQYHI